MSKKPTKTTVTFGFANVIVMALSSFVCIRVVLFLMLAFCDVYVQILDVRCRRVNYIYIYIYTLKNIKLFR